jgi:CheY-like chemotaxis protein
MASIVLIDDDPALRSVMRKVLERAGHAVADAENGVKGIALVERVRPDLVITDLVMPEKEGIETILELRDGFPDLPIIAVSGADGGEVEGPLVDASLFGAAAVLAKPFSIAQFLEVVESVLPPASS